MKSKLMTIRNFFIITAFILGSVSILGQTHTGLASSNNFASKNQSLPVIQFTNWGIASYTLQKVVDDFNANFSRNYGFKVDITPLDFSGFSAKTKLSIAIQNGLSTYDVIAMDESWISEFAQAGYIQPLNDAFNTSYQAQFFQAAIDAGTYNGQIYSVPWFHDSAMLYYRTDVLKYANANGIINDPNGAPPTTWAQLENWSVAMMGNQALVNKFNLTSGFVWQGRSYEGLMCDFMEYLGATGTYTFLSSQNGSTEFKNSLGLRDALSYMRSLITSGASPKSVLSYDEEGSRAVWNGGNTIFMRNWPYAYSLSLQSPYLNGSLVTGPEYNVQQFNVTSMPAQNATMTTNGLAKTSCLGGWQLGVFVNSKYPTNAKRFIMWITAAQQQTSYFLGAGQNPTLKALYNSPTLINSKQGYVHNFLPIFESSIPRPVTPIYQNISNTIVPTINSYLAGNISLDSAIKNMSFSVESVSNKALGISLSNETATITKALPSWEIYSELSVVFLALEVVIKRRKMNL